jgi:ClpP class serine protease
MRCSFCTYGQKPENLFLLKAHAEQEIFEGNTRGIIPVVVWKDGEFYLVEKAKDGEQVYEIGIIDPRPKEEPDLGFEPLPDEEEDDEEEMEEVVVRVKKKKPTTLL